MKNKPTMKELTDKAVETQEFKDLEVQVENLQKAWQNFSDTSRESLSSFNLPPASLTMFSIEQRAMELQMWLGNAMNAAQRNLLTKLIAEVGMKEKEESDGPDLTVVK